MSIKHTNEDTIGVWNLVKSYFDNNKVVHQQITSTEAMLRALPNVFKGRKLVCEKSKKIFVFGQTLILAPQICDNNQPPRPLFPIEARNRDLDYTARVMVDMSEITMFKDEVKESTVHNMVHIMDLPIMIGSSLCNTYKMSPKERGAVGECPYDPMGYFIINGNEMVMVGQERLNYNQIYIFTPQKINDQKKYEHIAEIRSLVDNKASCLQVKIEPDTKCITVSLPSILGTVPLSVVFCAMGYNDTEIRSLILPPNHEDDDEMNEFIDDILRAGRYNRRARDGVSPQQQCLELIASLTNYPVDVKCQKVLDLLENNIFPHLSGDKKTRAHYLGYTAFLLIMTNLGRIGPSDRDDFMNKRVENSGKLMLDLIQGLFDKYIQNMTEHYETHPVNIRDFSRPSQLTSDLHYAMATGTWGVQKNGYTRSGVSQLMTRYAYLIALSHLNRVTTAAGKEGKIIKPRQLHSSQNNFVCLFESPEGQSAGLLKNISIMTYITVGTNEIPIIKLIRSLEHVFPVSNQMTPIFVNGDWIGVTDKPEMIRDLIREKRRHRFIDFEVSVSYRKQMNQLTVFTDAGRLCRPVFTVKNGQIIADTDGQLDVFLQKLSIESLTSPEVNNLWTEWFTKGYIEYIDSNEDRTCHVATWKTDITSSTEYCCLHPSLYMGVSSSVIPFPNHSQAPRNAYQCSMGKQAMGVYALNYRLRMDTTSYILHYAQKPLVTTKMSHILKCNNLPSSQNVIVMVGCFTGANQEDGVIFNQGSIDRGLFTVTVYKTITLREKSQNDLQMVCIPEQKTMKASLNYRKLKSDTGVIRERNPDGTAVMVRKNDVIIGCVQNLPNGDQRDCSVSHKLEETGYVDKVMITRTGSWGRLIKVRLRFIRQMQLGDKDAGRSAQKNTICLILPEADMPFSVKDGIRPDLIINPLCFPSRMTINQMIEQILGKHAAVTGKIDPVKHDATAFSEVPKRLDQVAQELHTRGYQGRGMEKMCDGMSGELIEATIYLGPTSYQRLKHMIEDKLSARSKGPVQTLTRQPANNGRKNGFDYSSIRCGTMENDAFVSHGATSLIKERLYHSSDEYKAPVCDKCGLFASNGKICCKDSIVNDVNIPYANKLVFQEMMATLVCPRIRVKKDM